MADAEHIGVAVGFDFEFPDFPDPAARIVSRTIECWGSELLVQYTPAKSASPNDADWERKLFVWLRGRYDIDRRDRFVISVRYTIEIYPYRAAHRTTEIRVQNFLIDPFMPLSLQQMLVPDGGLENLANKVRITLREQLADRFPDGDVPGLRPEEENFSLFSLGIDGMYVHFSDYQLGSYAIGRPTVYLPYQSLQSIVRKEILDVFNQRDDI